MAIESRRTFCTILTLPPKAFAHGHLQHEWCSVACAYSSCFWVFPLLCLASNSHNLSLEAVSKWGINQISKTVLWTLEGVWVPQTLERVYCVGLRTYSTEFQESSWTRINQTLQRSNVWGKGFLWLGDNPNSRHPSLPFLYFPTTFAYAVPTWAGNAGKCVFHYTALSHLYGKTFLYAGGSKSPAVTAKNKFLIRVMWEKNNKWWYHTHTHAHVHAHTHSLMR